MDDSIFLICSPSKLWEHCKDDVAMKQLLSGKDRKLSGPEVDCLRECNPWYVTAQR